MNKLILLFVILLTVLKISAQEFYNTKYDYVWILGYGSDANSQQFGGTNINFNYDPPLIEEVYRDLNMNFTNASICDSEGNLQFYTNAFDIGNPLDEIMDNGDTILTDFFNFENSNYDALRIRQGALILPRPGNDHLYDLFHEEFSLDSGGELQVFTCYHSVIDMNENNGLGKVIQKSDILVKDTLDWGMLTATRHANGRDWWLLIPKYGVNTYFRFLITPEGVIPQQPQTFGTSAIYAGTGQIIFSPDGSKYINVKYGWEFNPLRVAISGFDRCSGLLTSEYLLQQSGIQYPLGAAISPNSRFFYLLEDRNLWQYDLFEPDIQGSKVKVAEWDGSVTYFLTGFFGGQSGPDGRIYLFNGNGNYTINIINHPDEKGVACDVIMTGVNLPNFNVSIPNFPNYRLGPIDGSNCDTLGIDNPLISDVPDIPESRKELARLYPNPASDYIFLQFSDPRPEINELVIYNALGEVVKESLLETGSSSIDIRNLPPGIYNIIIKSEDKKDQSHYSGKFIKI